MLAPTLYPRASKGAAQVTTTGSSASVDDDEITALMLTIVLRRDRFMIPRTHHMVKVMHELAHETHPTARCEDDNTR